MIKSLTYSIFLLGIFILGCDTPAPTSNPITDEYPADEEQLREMLVDIFETARAKNMDSLDAYHLNSPKFSKFDDGEVPQRQDYAMAKQTEEELFTAVSEFNYEIPDLKVDVFDDAAIATFILDYSIAVEDTTISAKGRGTLVFVKDQGRWKIAHEHFSPFIESQN